MPLPSAEVARATLRARRNTIGDALGRAAVLNRDRVALRFADRVWTFCALDAVTTRMAAVLMGAAAGLSRGDRVVAFGRNSDHYLLVWIACCKAGLVHVPANFALSGTELAYITAQCGASLLLHDAALATTAAQTGVAVRPIETLLPEAQVMTEDSGSEIGEDVADLDVAQILYTSGTTGLPKGAIMTHRALMAEYASSIIACEYSERDRALAALPLYHSAQMHAFTMPQLLVGAETTLIESPAPALCLDLIERHGLTSFFAPPTVWINLLRHPDFATRDLTSLRQAYYGAAIMPVPILEELRRRLPGVRVYNCYGQSEIAPLATVLAPEQSAARPASVGRPLATVRTRVVDAAMNDVPSGAHGEIVHRSPQLMLGYWGKPKETEDAFAGGWFHSGDIGYFDEDGYLYIVDRIKDVINTGGVLVASREVEDALFTHPAVSEVAVIALPDPVWIEAVVAVVVAREGHEVCAEALIEHARRHLAPFKLPKRVVFTDALPKNTAGKLLKRELRTRYGSGATPADDVARP